MENSQSEWWLKLMEFCDNVTTPEECNLRYFLAFYSNFSDDKVEIIKEALNNERNRILIDEHKGNKI